jgi:hypothetical protein
MESEIVIYQTEKGNTKIEVRLENNDVWLSQMQLTILYQKSKSTISEHLTDIFKEGELDEKTVVRNYRTTAADGKPYNTKFYNLDAIISLGYRVKSHIGTQFRIWATQRLNEYLVKGFTMDDERLKSGSQMNYFDELINRIRDIRSSEAIFYQKVKDIYVTSIDYDPKAESTKKFYATIQNKLHWAVHHHTAAELIVKRVDANKKDLGLTNWKSDRIRKSDVSIAKNYLSQDELTELNLLVEQYLAFAETQANAKKAMYMSDWIKKLNDILTINEKEILIDAGRITKELAAEIAEKQFDIYSANIKLIENDSNIKVLETQIKKVTPKKSPKK